MTGQGTPWGPMDSGAPDLPQLEEDFATSPYDPRFKGPDRSGVTKALADRLRASAAGMRAQGKANLLGSGIEGPDLARAEQEILSSQGQGIADLEAKQGVQEFEDSMGLMEAFNRLKQVRNENKLRKYGMDSDRFAGEQRGRGAFWSGLLKAGGKIGATALGGPAGAAVASAMD